MTVQRWTPDTVSSIAATVIGLCALVVSIMASYQSARHDRLMLTPSLVIDAKGVYTNLPADLASFEFSYAVTNAGLGPARIKEVTYIDTASGAQYQDPRTFALQRKILFKSLFMYGYSGEHIIKEGSAGRSDSKSISAY